MSFDNIVAGDYGQIATITVIDTDTKIAADISGYTTSLKMVFTSPSGIETEKPATFLTDGTDGVIKYTIENDILDTPGLWQVRAVVASSSSQLSSQTTKFKVLE